MGDEPIINSHFIQPMFILNFAEITSNISTPKISQARVFNSIENIKQLEYTTSLSKITSPLSIIFISR